MGIFVNSCFIAKNEGQYLQDNIVEECSHQIFAPVGIQQGHIQYHNVDALLFGADSLLLQNLLVVASQAVNAFDIEQIVFFQPAK